MSGLHDDALAVLRSWPAPDAGQEQVRRRYVAHLEAHPDGMRRSCRPDHLTASTLVLSDDGEHVLLTLHAKAERWFQLGGHCEPGDHLLRDAASREAREESGVPGLRLDPVPVQLSEHAVPFCRDPSASTDDGLTVHHLDVRFLAVAPPGSVPTVSEESLDVRWWPADALPDPDPDLVDLVRLARVRRSAQGEAVQSANSDGGMTFAPSDQPSR